MIGDICMTGDGLRFEQKTNWITPDYTIISACNQYVQYAVQKDRNKYDLTIYRLRNKVYPLKRFQSLPDPIVIVDKRMCPRTLIKYDSEMKLYLEEDSNGKIRLYSIPKHINELTYIKEVL